MKKRKKLGVTILLIFILILVPFKVNAFSNSLKNFVSNGKKVQLKLFDDLKEVEILTGTDVEVKNLDGSKRAFLIKDKKYIISPSQKEEVSWYIQVFATEEKNKAENIKEQLQNDFKEYEIQIVLEEELYKVQMGTFQQEAEAEEVSKNINEKGWETWVIEKMTKIDGTQLTLQDQRGTILFENGTIYCEGVIRFKNNLYNGSFQFQLNNGKVEVYNRVDFTTLQYGMLLESLPDTNNMTSLKAAAILNRSKGLHTIFTENSPYQIKEYQGISNLTDVIRVAVDKTKAKVIYKNNSPYYKEIDVKELGSSYSTAEELIIDNIDSIEIKDLNTTLDERQLVDASIDIGLEYREVRQLTWNGPRVMTIVDLDILKGRHEVVPFVSNDKIAGLESLSSVVRAKEALVGVNGGFFNYEGKPLGAVMIEGDMVAEPLYNRAALGITKTGEVLIDNLKWRGLAKTTFNSNMIIDAVNRKPNNENEIILYNQYFGEKTPQFQQPTIEIVVKEERIQKVEQGEMIQNDIPEDGYIIKIFNTTNQYEEFKLGKKVEYSNVFIPSWHEQDIVNIMGGGPKLISDGEISVSGTEEKFSQDITEGRAPRTAVGVTEDKHLIFVTVDGRQPELSIGMTLEELAEYLKGLNVKNAMNLDGGDSSQLVIRGYTFNNPSGYRKIATGILIKKK